MKDMEFLTTLLGVLGLITTLSAVYAKLRKPRPREDARLDAILYKVDKEGVAGLTEDEKEHLRMVRGERPRPQDHAKLDAILNKLAKEGIESLTEDEKEHLRMVRDKLRRAEERREGQL